MSVAIKNIIPEKLNDVKELQNALTLILNLLEKVLQENAELKVKMQQLQDENNKLKGGNARPDMKASKKNRDISSKGREQGKKQDDPHTDKEKPEQPIEIDKEIKVEIKPCDLPAD